ncbi:unnamed protein product [Penicillium bialowiezense]
MPSFAIRQSHSFAPSLPSSPKNSPSIPVRVDKSIDSKVFIELFAGTVGIFILAVLFWKIGKFIRHFNRNKVLKAGKTTNTRYARTWYGWVSRPTHERNKKAVRDCLAWVWDSMAWKSTRDDYSWVWWDPGDIERQKRRRQKRRLWWLPDCLKSYEDFPTADEIWNPCARPQCHGGLGVGFSPPQAPLPVTVQMPQSFTGNPCKPVTTVQATHIFASPTQQDQPLVHRWLSSGYSHFPPGSVDLIMPADPFPGREME